MLQNFTADATDPDDCLSDNDLTDIEQQGIAAAPDQNGVNLTPHDLMIKFQNVFRYAVVNFALKIREDYLLPQSTVTKILCDVHGLFECFSISFNDIIRKQIQVDPSEPAFEFLLNDETFITTVFSTLNPNRFGVLSSLPSDFPHVSVTEKTLGLSKAKKPQYIHIVSLRSSLEKILWHDDIASEILSYSHQLTRVPENHPVLFDIKRAAPASKDGIINLPIIPYIDEFEPCNPIGSRRKIHKLTGVYYSIAGLPPKYRSQLKTIFLYCLAYHSRVKQYGYASIFNDMLEDFKKFSQDPLTVKTRRGKVISYNVYLHFLSADNLSAHDILGLQTHFNHGYVSRYCLTKHADLQNVSDCLQCVVRTPEHFSEQLAKINSDANHTPQFGIRGECVFEELEYLNTSDLCPPDIMHDWHEGVVPAIIAIGLSSVIQKGKIKLDEINAAIQGFEYCTVDRRNRYGPVITKAQLKKGTIPGTASERLCLLRMLPLMLWQNFSDKFITNIDGLTLILKCLDINDILMAPVIELEWIPLLHFLISEHHQLVKKLSPTSITPKFHYLLHYPQTIIKFGPPRHYFTMRFESVHQYFKRLTQCTKNFKNLTQTLSNRYQNLKAFQLSNLEFFPLEFDITSGASVVINTLGEKLSSLLINDMVDGDEKVYITSSVELGQVKYSCGSILIHKLADDLVSTPQFVEICKLVKIRSKWVILASKFKTLGYENKLHSYTIRRTENYLKILPGEEIDHSLLGIYCVDGISVIPLKYRPAVHVSAISVCFCY